MNKIYLAALFIIFIGLTSFSQNDNGAIKVKLEDRATKEAIPFANVVAFKDGVQVGVGTTNMDGEAVIKPLSPGKYTVKGVYVGYQTQQINDVLVGEGMQVSLAQNGFSSNPCSVSIQANFSGFLIPKSVTVIIQTTNYTVPNGYKFIKYDSTLNAPIFYLSGQTVPAGTNGYIIPN